LGLEPYVSSKKGDIFNPSCAMATDHMASVVMNAKILFAI
jgi:hypothetical protein